jgi:thiol-disulfide isomerase/thioredoxin
VLRKSASIVGVMVIVFVAVTGRTSGVAQEEGCARAPLLASPAGEAAASPAPDALADAPTWQTIALTDACTGESFTLADFAGRTVYVELMATWCPPCRQQLHNARAAREQLGDDYVFVALSAEVDLPREKLAEYAENEGFDWIFAVMTPEMLQALVDAYGRAASNPPSTPHFVIGPDGAATELRTGFEGPDDLVANLTAGHEG